MVQSQQFSSGIEVATFVTSSGLLRKLWNVNDANIVSNVVGNNGLSWKVYKEQDTDGTIVAFETAPSNSANLQSELVSSTELKEKNFLHFQFLSTKANPLFHLNIAAVSLFFENHQGLDQLKSEVNSSPKLIITGLALGGSIASLFTLLLLDGFDSRKKKPLCITFGSPLIGDKGLQNSISHSSSWNSCFLHVVSSNDPLPRKFITDHTSSYVPFGTFLVCHDTYSTCFENSDSVLAVLETSIHDQSQVFGSVEYRNIVEILHRKAIWKDTANQVQGMNYSDSLQACIGLQLLTLGLIPHMQQQQQEIDIITLVEKMENLEKNFIKQKREKFDPSKKLNLMKINMAELEMYKTNSKNRNIGYYDSYKKMNSTDDHDVVTRHKKLSNYWKKMVQDSLMKPQKEGASLRTRWLYGGTTYRRMVEPLEIAQFYLNGGKDYVTTERSSHYKQLEDWLVEAAATTTSSNVTKDKVESILTLDSCFWAYVEEALISCKKLDEKLSDIEKDEATRKLVEFENYVYGLLKEYAVSPEIFLSESSYMAWWSQYKKIKAASYGSKLTNFMSNAYNYNVQYVGGTYKFD
ncbi:putative carboxylesterase [Medicago truncatula]|uniref:Putative carboxylesterase n=1 Tax=Medicago truncatula TaxID=3880 RepID=G7KIV1_MEDTR|nr:senescence-associated carboxylesterase 101 isoform X2 [Medicago truncatula]AES74541.2 senescence-associated protein [Medicago truncatula]RHN49894.1 putative carboxylesterase [Medicago truncatula]